MKAQSKFSSLVVALLFASAAVQAQEWTEEQLEVWALVEQSWVDDVAENDKWPADYAHEKYVSWNAASPMPWDRDTAIKWGRFADESSDTIMYEAQPTAIVVEDDTAVVHYYVTLVTENAEGERNNSVRRIIEVLVRDRNEWKWLSGVDYASEADDD